VVHDPPRVSYRTETYLDNPKLGIRHDHAYWLSAIRGRQTGRSWESVDLTTQACGGSVPTTSTGNGAGTDPVPWVSFYRSRTGLRTPPRAMKLTGTLTNVKSLTIEADASCLAGRSFDYDITTDGNTTIRLSDRRVLILCGSGEKHGTLKKASKL
jgi:hypothetical protein